MAKNVWKITPHIQIILALFLGTLWVLDQLNPLMNFLDNAVAGAALFAFILLALANGAAGVYREMVLQGQEEMRQKEEGE